MLKAPQNSKVRIVHKMMSRITNVWQYSLVDWIFDKKICKIIFQKVLAVFIWNYDSTFVLRSVLKMFIATFSRIFAYNVCEDDKRFYLKTSRDLLSKIIPITLKNNCYMIL